MAGQTELDKTVEAGDERVRRYTLDGDATHGSAQNSTDQSGTEKPEVETSPHAELGPLGMLSRHYSAAFGPASLQQINELDHVMEDIPACINSRAHLYDNNVHPLAILHDVLGRSLRVVTQTLDIPNDGSREDSMLSTGDRVVTWAGSRAEEEQAVTTSSKQATNDLKKSSRDQLQVPQHRSRFGSAPSLRQAETSPKKLELEEVVDSAAHPRLWGSSCSLVLHARPGREAREDDDNSSLGSLFEDRDVIQSVEHAHNYVVQNSDLLMDVDDDDYGENSECFQGIDRGRVSTPASSSPSCSPPPTPTPAARPRPRAIVTQPTPLIPRRRVTRMTRPSTDRKRAAGVAFKVDRTPLGGRTVHSEPKKKIQCLR